MSILSQQTYSQTAIDQEQSIIPQSELNNVEPGWFFYPYFLAVEPINNLSYLSASHVYSAGNTVRAVGGAETNDGEFKLFVFNFEDGEWETELIKDLEFQDGENVHTLPLYVHSFHTFRTTTGYNLVSSVSGDVSVLDPSNTNFPDPVNDGDEWIVDVRQAGNIYTMMTSQNRFIARIGSSFELYDHDNSPLPEAIDGDGVGTDKAARYLAYTEGHVWMHTHREDGGLFVWDTNVEWEHFTSDNSDLPGDFVTSVVADGGVVWVGMAPSSDDPSGGGLVRIEGDEWTVYTGDDLPSNAVRVHAVGGNGWVYATFGNDSNTIDDTREGPLATFNGSEWIGLADQGEFYSSLTSVDVQNDIIWMTGDFDVINGGVASLRGSYLDFTDTPEGGRSYASGHQVRLEWDAGEFVSSVELSWSSDQGDSWNTIESDIEGSIHFYELPDGNYEDFRIRVQSEQDAELYDETDDFTVLDPDEPYYHVRNLHGDGLYEFYDPFEHGWSFSNTVENFWFSDMYSDIEYSGPLNYLWQGEAHHFPSFDYLIEAFGEDETISGYTPIFENIIPTAKGGVLWSILRLFGWSGVCHGFAVTTSLAFTDGNNSLSVFDVNIDAEYLYEQELNDDIRHMMNMIWTRQWGRDHLGGQVFNALNESALQQLLDMISEGNFNPEDAPGVDEFFKSPSTTLEEVKEMTSRVGPGEYYNHIVMFPMDDLSEGTLAHAIFPYKVEQDDNQPHLWYIYVHDSNIADSDDTKIMVNTQTETWDYLDDSRYDGSNGLFLGDSSQDYRSTSRLWDLDVENEIPELEDFGYMYTMFGPGSDINITGPLGDEISFSDDAITGELPGAYPIIPPSGNEHQPVGYFLLDFDYEIEMDYQINSNESQGRLGLFSGSSIYHYYNLEPNPNSPDFMRYGNSLTVYGKQVQDAYIFNLDVIEETDGEERIYRMLDFTPNGADSLTFFMEDQSDLVIQNYGSGGTFNLEIHDFNDEDEYFLYHGLTLAESSSYKFVPDWDDIGNREITVKVDTNMDGEYDEEYTLEGLDTSIPDDDNGDGSTLPDDYELHQNYPNPFNPVTMIQYSIPEAQHVRLEVYNMIGQRVAVLVDDMRPAGTHQVQFNAENLSSGMYLYRITAGSFIDTGKMMFVK